MGVLAAVFVLIGGMLSFGAMAGKIHEAARLGKITALEQQIDSGAPIETLDARGDTPLIAAAYAGQLLMVRHLLAAGAKVDGRSDRGLTALHAAAYRGHRDIVALLIKQGADINDQTNKFRITPLHAAAEENHLDIVAVLISEGADIDRKEANAITPLSRAGWRENWEIFEMLKKAGARCQPMNVVGPELYERCVATGQ
jgi:ankyrin repeat protein